MKLYDYQTIIEMLPRLLVLSFQYSALYFTMSFFSTPLWPSLIASAVFFFVMSIKLVTDAWACHWNSCRLSLAIFQTDFPWVKAITSGMSSCALVAWFNMESVTMTSAIKFCVCMGVYKQTSPCLLLQKPSPLVSLHRQYSELLDGKFSVRLVFGTVILWIASKIIGGTFSAWALCTLVIMLVDLPTARFIAKFKAKC